MKGLIIKYQGVMIRDDIDSVMEKLMQDIERDGFAVIDGRIKSTR